MKKIMILPVIALTFGLAMPQLSQATNVQNEFAVTQEKDVKYTEITEDQVPEAVSKALEKDYAGHKIDKAFKGDDGTYKLAVSKSEHKMVLFFSEDGKLIKSKKAEAAKTEKSGTENPQK